jgi:hypothetical protein
MPRLTLTIPHSLTTEEAKRRLTNKLAAALTEHGDRLSNFSQQWQEHTLSFAFQAMGMSIDGKMAVEPKCVNVDANLPFAVALFKGAIESRLHQEVSALLAPS